MESVSQGLRVKINFSSRESRFDEFSKHLKLLIALSLKLSSLGFESGSLRLLPLYLLLVDPAYSAAFDLFIDSSSSRLSTS